MNPLEAIKAACMDCVTWISPRGTTRDVDFIKQCPMGDYCPLHRYRLGYDSKAETIILDLLSLFSNSSINSLVGHLKPTNLLLSEKLSGIRKALRSFFLYHLWS